MGGPQRGPEPPRLSASPSSVGLRSGQNPRGPGWGPVHAGPEAEEPCAWAAAEPAGAVQELGSPTGQLEASAPPPGTGHNVGHGSGQGSGFSPRAPPRARLTSPHPRQGRVPLGDHPMAAAPSALSRAAPR